MPEAGPGGPVADAVAPARLPALVASVLAVGGAIAAAGFVGASARLRGAGAQARLASGACPAWRGSGAAPGCGLGFVAQQLLPRGYEPTSVGLTPRHRPGRMVISR
jgi:hypothetical protein